MCKFEGLNEIVMLMERCPLISKHLNDAIAVFGELGKCKMIASYDRILEFESRANMKMEIRLVDDNVVFVYKIIDDHPGQNCDITSLKETIGYCWNSNVLDFDAKLLPGATYADLMLLKIWKQRSPHNEVRMSELCKKVLASENPDPKYAGNPIVMEKLRSKYLA